MTTCKICNPLHINKFLYNSKKKMGFANEQFIEAKTSLKTTLLQKLYYLCNILKEFENLIKRKVTKNEGNSIYEQHNQLPYV